MSKESIEDLQRRCAALTEQWRELVQELDALGLSSVLPDANSTSARMQITAGLVNREARRSEWDGTEKEEIQCEE